LTDANAITWIVFNFCVFINFDFSQKTKGQGQDFHKIIHEISFCFPPKPEHLEYTAHVAWDHFVILFHLF